MVSWRLEKRAAERERRKAALVRCQRVGEQQRGWGKRLAALLSQGRRKGKGKELETGEIRQLAGKDVINKLNREREKCGERGSNTRPSDLQSDALPTELSPPALLLLFC
ncbi:hypothetical protein NC652_012589 [Populus alba x Populus x berolinensis]|nr:hypothetical protein NC652_012581 [Populus alba x Populus x berolinensis]KAJ6928514.1 hypothetical protein NC652_012585 [Populus alba x Populus x berolinensis]KAJ6928518.1 hypothetical protein NC652_012589 [Populus alba x Populus x berolinensis]